ncbi:MAG: hypothetical protein I8H82_04965 [Rhodocyclales bacterium]|jgi:hypothetical protein|nr:hypothetical protein [Rhodocyclales bacterium]MBH1975033.1 hypothetical protein [Rhodocyclales bacterium]MBT9461603.1 hypothetical protein [Rugosibacter sp.]
MRLKNDLLRILLDIAPGVSKAKSRPMINLTIVQFSGFPFALPYFSYVGSLQ